MHKARLERVSYLRLIIMIFFTVIVMVAISVCAGAEENQEKEYAQIISEGGCQYISIDDELCYYADSESTAAAFVRQMLENRTESIKLAYGLTENADQEKAWEKIEEAVYSGDKDSDYLKLSTADIELLSIDTDWLVEGTNKRLIYYEIRPEYYATSKEEKILDNDVRSIISSLSLKGLSDYEKSKKIYRYVCQNVSYDWNYDNSSFYAYGALKNKKAVCQGFALLFYRLGKEAGLNVGIQCGKEASGEDWSDHAWNVVKINGSYYYIDTTWDSKEEYYSYFLKGSKSFLEDHKQESGFNCSVQAEDYKITGKDQVIFTDNELLVEKITLSGNSKKIAAGKSIKLTAVPSPEYARNKNIIWESSNTKVATVTKTGKVKIKKNAGGKKVTITALADDGSGTEAVYKIKVMKGVVKKVKINRKKSGKTTKKMSVKAGKSLKLKVTVKASAGANKKIKWKSSDKKLATVSKKGVVKAKAGAKGKKVKITASATDGSGKKDTITIAIK